MIGARKLLPVLATVEALMLLLLVTDGWRVGESKRALKSFLITYSQGKKPTSGMLVLPNGSVNPSH